MSNTDNKSSGGDDDGDNNNEKQQRNDMITKEIDIILKEFDGLLMDNEYDVEEEANDALRKAAFNIAYTKKYYNVTKDEIIYFPSVSKLIMNAKLIVEGEKYYYDEEDEFPIHYSKLLKTAVSTVFPTKNTTTQKTTDGDNEEGEEEDDEEYMEKLAMDVEI